MPIVYADLIAEAEAVIAYAISRRTMTDPMGAPFHAVVGSWRRLDDLAR